MEAASISAAHAHDDHHHGRRRRTAAPAWTRACSDAAVHHQRDHGLRGLLHGLLLHPGRGHPRRLVPHRRQGPPGRRRGRQHRDPALVVADAALGADVDQERQPLRPAGGHVTTFLLGSTFLFVQINEYVHMGFAPAGQNARLTSSSPSPACTAPTSHRPVAAAQVTGGCSRATTGPRTTRGSSIPASTGTSSTSCGSSSASTSTGADDPPRCCCAFSWTVAGVTSCPSCASSSLS